MGGTYAGNPVAVAAAHAVLDIIEEEGLCKRANDLGAELVDVLHELKMSSSCLLYTSDAADDSLRVDLGGRRIIKKKKRNKK